jgi:hypothetical protein
MMIVSSDFPATLLHIPSKLVAFYSSFFLRSCGVDLVGLENSDTFCFMSNTDVFAVV